MFLAWVMLRWWGLGRSWLIWKPSSFVVVDYLDIASAGRIDVFSVCITISNYFAYHLRPKIHTIVRHPVLLMVRSFIHVWHSIVTAAWSIAGGWRWVASSWWRATSVGCVYTATWARVWPAVVYNRLQLWGRILAGIFGVRGHSSFGWCSGGIGLINGRYEECLLLQKFEGSRRTKDSCARW